mmetsp:Transcript_1255/g.4672  ORF Transcript_1255/g.4672 Transcript_1255/m.4672 type:complete len:431 (-) Transcript_1255:92-1384(-)
MLHAALRCVASAVMTLEYLGLLLFFLCIRRFCLVALIFFSVTVPVGSRGYDFVAARLSLLRSHGLRRRDPWRRRDAVRRRPLETDAGPLEQLRGLFLHDWRLVVETVGAVERDRRGPLELSGRHPTRDLRRLCGYRGAAHLPRHRSARSHELELARAWRGRERPSHDVLVVRPGSSWCCSCWCDWCADSLLRLTTPRLPQELRLLDGSLHLLLKLVLKLVRHLRHVGADHECVLQPRLLPVPFETRHPKRGEAPLRLSFIHASADVDVLVQKFRRSIPEVLRRKEGAQAIDALDVNPLRRDVGHEHLTRPKLDIFGRNTELLLRVEPPALRPPPPSPVLEERLDRRQILPFVRVVRRHVHKVVHLHDAPRCQEGRVVLRAIRLAQAGLSDPARGVLLLLGARTTVAAVQCGADAGVVCASAAPAGGARRL